MSVETELVPSEIENIKILHTKNIVPFSDEVVIFSIIYYELY